MEQPYRKLWSFAVGVIAAGITAISLAAGNQPDLGPADITLHQTVAPASGRFGDGRNFASIAQDGINMQAVITQQGSELEAIIQQVGAQNEALILQSGAGHHALINQYGYNNQAFIEQQGTHNSALIEQTGSDKRSAISQSGQLVNILVRQYR